MEAAVEDLFGDEQVAQVGAAVALAGFAGALGVKRCEVGGVLGVADVDLAQRGEELAVSGIASRHDAVKHVDAGGDGADEVARGADAHQVTRAVARQLAGDLIE